MNMASASVGRPSKAGAVTIAVDTLDRSLAALNDAVGRVEARLASVLSEAPPVSGAPQLTKVSSGTPLAAKIFELSERLLEQCSRLDGVIERVEV